MPAPIVLINRSEHLGQDTYSSRSSPSDSSSKMSSICTLIGILGFLVGLPQCLHLYSQPSGVFLGVIWISCLSGLALNIGVQVDSILYTGEAHGWLESESWVEPIGFRPADVTWDLISCSWKSAHTQVSSFGIGRQAVSPTLFASSSHRHSAEQYISPGLVNLP